MTEQQINELGAYLGSDPCPPDFDAFWAERMAEADAVPLQWGLQPADEEPLEGPCTCYDLWFSGMGGARLYAKYLRPAVSCPPVLLQFHGYPGASRSWFEQASFPALGYALIAMDNPGQGGRSQDTGGFLGTTVAGHLVAGAEGEPRDLYYVRLYQDVRILCRIVEELGKRGELDLGHVYVNGASQGGGMGVACCALNPQLVNRAAILYPFLSDFRKVSELDADEVAYEGLRYWSRWFDPDGTRADELFGRLAYYDTKNFAHLVRCPVFFGTGLDDVVCPPPTQCATYNQLGGPHERLLYPGFGHEEIQDFDDAAVLFFGAGDRGVVFHLHDGASQRHIARQMVPTAPRTADVMEEQHRRPGSLPRRPQAARRDRAARAGQLELLVEGTRKLEGMFSEALSTDTMVGTGRGWRIAPAEG